MEASGLAPVAEEGPAPAPEEEAPDQEGPPGEGPVGGEAGPGPASAGDGAPQDETGDEEARRPEKARDPCAPTRAQWEEHQGTHLPFRILVPPTA